MSRSPSPWLFLLPTAMMPLALADMPYGYYQVLRLVTFVAASMVAFSAWNVGREAWAVAFGLLAIIYNPIFRVALEREQWAVINLASAALLVIGLVASRRWNDEATV